MYVGFLAREVFEVTDPYMSISSVESRLLDNSFLVVLEKGEFLGILTPADILESSHQLVIDCLIDKPHIDFNQGVESTLNIMNQTREFVLPLFKDSRFIGVVSQADIAPFLNRYRKELEKEIQKHTSDLADVNAKLKKEIEDHSQTEAALQKASVDLEERVMRRTAELAQAYEQLNALLNSTSDSSFLMDLEGRVTSSNQIAAKRFGMDLDQFLGQCIYDLMPPSLAKSRNNKIQSVINTGTPHRCEDMRIGINFDLSIYPVLDLEGKVAQIAIHGKDITDRVKAYQVLEERRKELEAQSRELSDVNAALRVLLKKREDDKKALEEKISLNVEGLVVPYIERLKDIMQDGKGSAYLNMLELNLKDIVSPFLRRLSLVHKSLTPTEIRVANLIRQGKTSKEIAKLLNIGERTIDTHREGIRRKMKIKNKAVNLRTYLISIQ